MILVDTSAWGEFFRGKAPVADRVEDLLASNEVALCGPVVTELRRGIRSAMERRKVLPLLGGCHFLDQPAALWEEAGELGYALARMGTVVKTLDLLIATCVLAHSVPLLTCDTDFALMRDAGIPLILA
ncbi:MAG: PIN domain-containing protein [Myxococcota bacterium]